MNYEWLANQPILISMMSMAIIWLAAINVWLFKQVIKLGTSYAKNNVLSEEILREKVEIEREYARRLEVLTQEIRELKNNSNER
jgi:hypothetical protein